MQERLYPPGKQPRLFVVGKGERGWREHLAVKLVLGCKICDISSGAIDTSILRAGLKADEKSRNSK